MQSAESARSAESGRNFVRDVVRDAYEARRQLRIIGAGTWLGAGRPVDVTDTLSLAADTGIVEYVPGDLTLTARAGTRLSEIAMATRAQGQWLPLDPWGAGGDDGTIGATVSTATSGPYAHAMGLPRDIVLGLEFVTGIGETVRSGGRVVKNVAGFDLTRLLVGSWGTLGVITEVTIRLRARPEVTRTVAIAVTPETLVTLAVRLRALPFTPIASELLSPSLATTLGFDRRATLLVQLGGNERSVRAQRDLLANFGSVFDSDDSVWNRLRTSVDSNATWRWSQLPSLFGDTWRAAENLAERLNGVMFHGNPARGVVRVVVPPAASTSAAALAAATQFDGTVAIESLLPEAWNAVNFRTASDPISRAIREKFDPAGILNAGILGVAS